MGGSFFFRGLLIGFAVAAVVGPMSILCIQRTLSRGHLYGMVSGLGVATADAIYGSVAGFGLTLIASALVSLQGWLRLIGGLFLAYMGIKIALSKPAERAAAAQAHNFVGAYASTFLLALTNPSQAWEREAQVKVTSQQPWWCAGCLQDQPCGGVS
jgi:threonine/homoserine/homoserine lactone efflux protein